MSAEPTITPLALSGFGALAMLLIALAISAFRSQRSDSKEILSRLDSVKDAGAEQKGTLGRLEERFTGLEARVDDIHRRKNEEHARLLVIAADAILELRNDRREGPPDRRQSA